MKSREFSKRTILSGSILFVVSVWLCRLPIFNYLGYEFSAAIALVFPCLVGFIFIGTKGMRISPGTEIGRRDFRPMILRMLRVSLMLLAIPWGIATLNIFFVKNCSYFEGLLFFLLIPVVTGIFSVSLAGLSLVIARRPSLVYLAFLALILLHPLYLGYVSPQIYSYNPVYGYFPGFSYDEVLTISSTLLIFRALTLGFSLLLILMSMVIVETASIHDGAFTRIMLIARQLRFDGRNVTMALLLILLVGAFLFRGRLDFETSTARLQQELSSRCTTEHFRIFYAPGSFSDDEIRWVSEEHEFRFHQVEEALQTHFSDTIDSYIYPDPDAKRLLIGTGTTNIAKPWRKEVHLNKQSWESTLKHELVHVVAGQFGMPVIKAHYNIGLVEGLATAVDNDFGNRTLHEYAAAVSKFGILTKPNELISPAGFMLHSSSLSYVLMGSFCKYLIDHYGMVRFKELYGGKSAARVYGKSYDQLVESWQHFLLRVATPAGWRKHVEFYFKRPSIFAKECVRTIAKLNQEGFRCLAERNSAAAMELFSRSLGKSWNSEAFSGLVRSAYQAGRYDTVIKLINSQAVDSTGFGAVRSLLLFYGDALWHEGKIDPAREAYEEVLALDFSESYDEAVRLRLMGISDRELQNVARDYFLNSSADSAEVRILDEIQQRSPGLLLSYLRARIFVRLKEYQKVIDALETVHTPYGIPILDAGKAQLLGQSYFHLKKFQRAKMEFWRSLNFITNQASAQRTDDWLERCDWYEENRGHYLVDK